MHNADDKIIRVNFASGPKVSVKVLLEKGKLKETFLEISTSFSAEIHGEGSEEVVLWLERYSKGIKAGCLPELFDVSSFAKEVLTVLKGIPFNKSLSYKQVAERAGNSSAARAVGQAVGANPIPLFIPCHRVVRSDGSIGGFSQGVKVKERLISFEKGLEI